MSFNHLRYGLGVVTHTGELLRWVPHLNEGGRRALEWTEWALAGVWCVRTNTLMHRLGEVPDLTEVRWDLCPVRAPGLVVVVPAKDEADTIGPAMETLLAQDYPWLRVIAVDDRSSDGTGRILEDMAVRRPESLAVLHLTEAAEGWVAKTFAMEAAARQSGSEWLLFTEADVWFSPSVLRRALAFAEMSRADHLAIVPSRVVRRWDEGVLLGFLSVLELWMLRPWRVADPKATWDAAGAGAFSMIRRDVWEELGGFAPQRTALLEALTLGRRVRAAGLRQRLVYAPGLVLASPRVGSNGASGLLGLARSMTKTAWAALNFRLWMALGSALFVAVVFLGPLAGLFWWPTVWPSLLILVCLSVQYRTIAEVTGIEARWGWLYPLGVLGLLWALVRSVAVAVWRGGVRWRGTFYPLRELRRGNSAFVWESEAARERAQRRRVERGMRPSRWLKLANRARERTPFRRRGA